MSYQSTSYPCPVRDNHNHSNNGLLFNPPRSTKFGGTMHAG